MSQMDCNLGHTSQSVAEAGGGQVAGFVTVVSGGITTYTLQ